MPVGLRNVFGKDDTSDDRRRKGKSPNTSIMLFTTHSRTNAHTHVYKHEHTHRLTQSSSTTHTLCGCYDLNCTQRTLTHAHTHARTHALTNIKAWKSIRESRSLSRTSDTAWLLYLLALLNSLIYLCFFFY